MLLFRGINTTNLNALTLSLRSETPKTLISINTLIILNTRNHDLPPGTCVHSRRQVRQDMFTSGMLFASTCFNSGMGLSFRAVGKYNPWIKPIRTLLGSLEKEGSLFAGSWLKELWIYIGYSPYYGLLLIMN